MQATTSRTAILAKPRASYPLYNTSRMVVTASMQPKKAASVAFKSLASLSAVLVISVTPAYAKLDTETYPAGVGATIEASPIDDQQAQEVVRLLKDKVLPEVEAKLSECTDPNDCGSLYPESMMKELKTIRNELDALDKQSQGGGSTSNIKSLASAIEQQINAVKAALGFD